MARVLAGTAVAVALAAAVIVLRETTMSRHVSTPAGSTTEIVVRARTSHAQRQATEEELTTALVLTCRLHVDSGLVGGISRVGDHTYSFVVTPALDESDRRQLHGCLEDMRIDHLQLGVVELHDRGVDESN